MATMNNEVATGRRMNSREGFTEEWEGASPAPSHASPRKRLGCAGEAGARTEAVSWSRHISDSPPNEPAQYPEDDLAAAPRLVMTPQAIRPPLLPVGSVFMSSLAACTTTELPSASKRLVSPAP